MDIAFTSCVHQEAMHPVDARPVLHHNLYV